MVKGNGMCSPLPPQLAILHSTPGALNFIPLGGDAMSQPIIKPAPYEDHPITIPTGQPDRRRSALFGEPSQRVRFENGSAPGVQRQSRPSTRPPISCRARFLPRPFPAATVPSYLRDDLDTQPIPGYFS
jgi:hypothetical protein